MLVTTRQKLPFLANHEISIQILDNTPIERAKSTKALGVILHENLSWVKHVEKIHKKVAAGIDLLRCIRDFTSLDILIKIYKSLIQPHFEAQFGTTWMRPYARNSKSSKIAQLE